MLEVVELAGLGLEDVDNYVAVVHGYPVCIFKSTHTNGFLAEAFTSHITYGAGDSLYLIGTVALAYYEVFADRVFDAREVGDDYAPAFLLLYSFGDDLK